MWLRQAEGYSASRDEWTVVLPLRGNRYHGLDGWASRVWRLLTDWICLDDLISRLAVQYNVAPDSLRDPVSSFVAELQSRNLVEARTALAGSSSRSSRAQPTPGVRGALARAVRTIVTIGSGRCGFRPPTLVSCAVLLLLLRTTLKCCGLGLTLEALEPAPHGDRRDFALAKAVAARVAAAAAFLPGRVACLEQSLAIYVLLRRRGVPASFHLGVHSYRFAAHAWAQLDDRPLNEETDVVATFIPLQRSLPSCEPSGGL